MRRLARYGLGIAAAVVCVWFALGVRQAREVNTATRLLNNAGTERRTSVQRQVHSALNAAALLYPGTDITLLRAQLAENRRDYPVASRLLGQAMRAEPENLNVWLDDLRLYILAPAQVDHTLLERRLRQLDPSAFAGR